MYSTIANIRTQSAFKDSDKVADTYITRKITEADNIIDSIIGEVYDLPLSETPGIIQNISESLVALLLYQEQNPNIEVQPGINVIEEWNMNIETLEKIRERKIKLYDSNGDELTITDRIKPQYIPNDTTTSADADADDYTPRFFEADMDF